MIEVECEESGGQYTFPQVSQRKGWYMLKDDLAEETNFVFKLFRIVGNIFKDCSAFYKDANPSEVSTLHKTNIK